MRRPKEVTVNYEDLVYAIAEGLAKMEGDTPKACHGNSAKGIIWPLLNDEDQSRLVMR